MLAPNSFAARRPETRLVVPTAVNPNPEIAIVAKAGAAEKTASVAMIRSFVFILKSIHGRNKKWF